MGTLASSVARPNARVAIYDHKPKQCAASSHSTARLPPAQIDKEGANPERVKQELTEHNLIPGGRGRGGLVSRAGAD